MANLVKDDSARGIGVSFDTACRNSKTQGSCAG